MKRADLTGRKFERLKVIGISDKKRATSWLWECRCSCGNIVYCRAWDLTSGSVRSCGCLKRDHMREVNDKHKNDYAHNTNIHKALPKKLNKNNTSGHRGVCWSKNAQRWTVYIRFQKKSYYLGIFEDIQDAIKARREAEQKLHGPFLEWYRETYPERFEELQKKRKSIDQGE